LSSILDSHVIERLFELFWQIKADLLIWVPALIMIRVLLNLVLFKSAGDMATILKDAALGILLLCFFVQIVKASQIIPDMLHERLSSPDQVEVKFGNQRVVGFALAAYIAVASYWIAKCIYLVFIGILILTGGFVIIAGTLLAQRFLLNLLFIALLGVSCMPLIWFVINEAMKALAQSDDGSMANWFILAGGELFKIGIPLSSAYALLKNPFTEEVTRAVGAPVKGAQLAAQGTVKVASQIHPQMRVAAKVAQSAKAAKGSKGIKGIGQSQVGGRSLQSGARSVEGRPHRKQREPYPVKSENDGGRAELRVPSVNTAKTSLDLVEKASVSRSQGPRTIAHQRTPGEHTGIASSGDKTVKSATKNSVDGKAITSQRHRAIQSESYPLSQSQAQTVVSQSSSINARAQGPVSSAVSSNKNVVGTSSDSRERATQSIAVVDRSKASFPIHRNHQSLHDHK
jgi:hypothetical protein